MPAPRSPGSSLRTRRIRRAGGTSVADPALRAALGALTAEQREVVGLRFVADLSLEDVAAVTGRSVHAVKALQQRAHANLRRAVSQPA